MNRYIPTFLLALLISVELLGQAGLSRAKEVDISARSERSSAKEIDISKTPRPTAPANLEISDVTFSDQYGNSNSILDANEEAEIRFTLSNRRKRQCACTCRECRPREPYARYRTVFQEAAGRSFRGR